MDQPLLALTRPRDAELPAETPATDSLRQLVQLRWLAVAGQLVTILFVAYGLRVPLPLLPMLGVVGLLALANLIGSVLLPRHRITNLEILGQLLLDMASLTAQLYLSGGATNPFTAFYLLQLVLGAILLERWSVWLLLVVASGCYAGLTARFVPLAYPPGLLPEVADLQTFGRWAAFALTGTLLALFVTRITRNLRARDLRLADLRQHAAEEDGIVRMGLFASGAAHELGTPLASLSVVLNDWRRLPTLRDDPELASELDEMLGEVARCKRIVTGILHSAGHPRGEALASVPAAAFLDEVVAAWRPTHAAVPLVYTREGQGGAVIADPALRQAIWNLLDNAAEASPQGIAMDAVSGGGQLVLTVTDAGPGFAAALLGEVGRLGQSSKGAGHGIGLFLAATVARRLGGRLEAANRAAGGAAVTLILPLVGREG